MAGISAPQALRDITFDSASCSRIVLGTTRVGFIGFKSPEQEIKVKKYGRIGEMANTVRTPGFAELADIFDVEMLLADYSNRFLPALPTHGITLYEFPIITSAKHPSINGSFNTLIDGCRIVKNSHSEMKGGAGSEDARTVKLGISYMHVWEMGADGTWKCLTLDNALPSSAAQALIGF